MATKTSALASLPLTPPYSGWAKTTIDDKNKVVWFDLQYEGRPCFSFDLLTSLKGMLDGVEERLSRDPGAVRYQVLHSSSIPGVFGMGGDLEYFFRCIRNGDKEGLRRYAHLCIDVLYPTTDNFGGRVTTIALIEGTAFGGAFEAALAHSFIVAERGSKLCFPESLFGFFPGMGAYSYLARRVHPALAKRIITSGENFSAEALHELGIIDLLAEPGEGRAAVEEHIKRAGQMAGLHAMNNVVNRVFPVSKQELYDITDLWVETAFTLNERNLRMMERFARSQASRWEQAKKPSACA